MATPESPVDAEIYSVTQLNREARLLLESALPGVWIEGELSNLAQPGSGHLYFSLKDASAQVRCAMFRTANRQLNFRPADGLQVLVHARVSIYEPRGAFQLIVGHMEEAGLGLLRRKFEELKARLDAEGLFAAELKQPLPRLPNRIGIVTSPTGAAVRDILHVLARRYPAAEVIIYPTLVQGEGSAQSIARAIDTAAERRECDVLIVARGGGSLEDLWSFNEECVARAIHRCALPVVSGVGHEVDFTIADLVADVRAPTPSGAAELVTPDSNELLAALRGFDHRLTRTLGRYWTGRQQQHLQLMNRLMRVHPGAVLRQLQQRADELTRQLVKAQQARMLQERVQHREMNQRLLAAAPHIRLARLESRLANQVLRLKAAGNRRLQVARNRLSLAAGQLHTVSPLATLERGYAIVQDASTGRVIRNAQQTKAGDSITAKLAQGSVEAVITGIRSK